MDLKAISPLVGVTSLAAKLYDNACLLLTGFCETKMKQSIGEAITAHKYALLLIGTRTLRQPSDDRIRADNLLPRTVILTDFRPGI